VPLTDPVYLLAILLATIFIAPAIANKLHIPALVVLTLPSLLGEGFFFQPATLVKFVSKSNQRVICPEAFTP
jgi:hypothetical protein